MNDCWTLTWTLTIEKLMLNNKKCSAFKRLKRLKVEKSELIRICVT